MATSEKYRECQIEFENVWEHKQTYFCKREEECCSTEAQWNGCCKEAPGFLDNPTIELQYIIAIAAVVFVIVLLIIVGICLIIRKRRRRRAKYRPSAPPLSEMSPVPPYSDGKLPSYSEACQGNHYNWDRGNA